VLWMIFKGINFRFRNCGNFVCNVPIDWWSKISRLGLGNCSSTSLFLFVKGFAISIWQENGYTSDHNFSWQMSSGRRLRDTVKQNSVTPDCVMFRVLLLSKTTLNRVSFLLRLSNICIFFFLLLNTFP
jgi:hypothetical protein